MPPQAPIDDFTPDREEIKITRTVRCKLETSSTKNELVQQGYQRVASYMADRTLAIMTT